MKRSILHIFLFICVFLSFTSTTHALNSIVVTEIMYDLDGTDTDREWVEIKNTTNTTIDLSGWKFNDGSNHILNIPPANGGTGDIQIPPGDIVIIASNASVFLSEYPTFSKTVIDTVMSLSNTVDTVKIISDTGDIVDEVSYQSDMGANGDGKSLQLYNGNLIAASPTPGVLYVGSSGGGEQEGTPPVVPTQPKNEPPKEYPIVASMDFSVKTILSKVPFVVKPLVTGKNKEQIRYGKFLFTLGDGRVIEQSSLQPFQIEYTYPGNYVLYFEYYAHSYNPDPNAIERVQVIVKNSPLVIDTIDDVGSIYITNTESQDVDISSYILTSGNTSFLFPKNTFIPGGKSIVIDSYIHKLFPFLQPTILYSPSHKKLFTYNGKIPSNTVDAKSVVSINSEKPANTSLLGKELIVAKKDNTLFFTGSPEIPPYVVVSDDEISINHNKLVENPLLSQTVGSSTQTTFSFNWYTSFVILLILGSVILIFFLKGSYIRTDSTSENQKEEDNYQIIEVK